MIKANYKIWIVSKNKYYSASRSKSTWLQRAAAIAAAEYSGYRSDDLEIHVYPLEAAEKYSFNDFIELVNEDLIKKSEERELRKKVKEHKSTIVDIEKVIQAALIQKQKLEEELKLISKK